MASERQILNNEQTSFFFSHIPGLTQWCGAACLPGGCVSGYVRSFKPQQSSAPDVVEMGLKGLERAWSLPSHSEARSENEKGSLLVIGPLDARPKDPTIHHEVEKSDDM